jgi:septation ring formation regulator EzrA
MQDDFESKFYKEIAEIESVKKKTGKLQSDYKKLSKRIDQLEILELQEQFNSLHDSLLETQRFIATLGIHYVCTHLLEMVQHQKPEMVDQIFSQLTADAAAARAQAKTSPTPMVIINQLSDKFDGYVKEWGIEVINIG